MQKRCKILLIEIFCDFFVNYLENSKSFSCRCRIETVNLNGSGRGGNVMQGKKWIAAALVCGFLLGQGTAPAQAGILGTVVKGGAVSLLVSQFADQLNSAINTLTAKYPISSDYATKVVPIITVGDGSYAGAAQVSGPKAQVDQCQAALQIEASFFKSFRAKALIPVDKVAVSGMNRVQGVGVSAQIDVKI